MNAALCMVVNLCTVSAVIIGSSFDLLHQYRNFMVWNEPLVLSVWLPCFSFSWYKELTL